MGNPTVKGYRGSWFADVGDERLPCVHKYWKQGNRYDDPGCLPGVGKWPRFVDAIRSGKKVVLTESNVSDAPGRKSGKALARKSYLSVWTIDKVEADDRSLRFEFVSNIQSFD